jgi:hypothetical protein
MSDYYQKQRGAVRLARALQERGWAIHGYVPDQSNPMTDYYAPASWFGIATRDDLTVVVGLSWGWDGETITGGESPYATLPETVRSAEVTWQPNPPRRNWHIERDGQIVASGVGIGSAGDWDKSRTERSLRRILQAIEGAERSESPEAGESLSDVHVWRNLEHDGVEIIFAEKPPDHIRVELKANAFRSSRRQRLRYARYDPQAWATACRIAGRKPGEEAPGRETGNGPDASPL